MECPECYSTKNIKYGFVKGKQRYKCKNCNKTFRLKQINLTKPSQVIQLYLEGLKPTLISKLSTNRISDITIRRWLNKVEVDLKGYRKPNKVISNMIDNPDEIPSEIASVLRNNISKIRSGVLIIGLDINKSFSYVLRVQNYDQSNP